MVVVYVTDVNDNNPEVNPREVTLTKDKRLPGERLITIQVSMSPWQQPRGQSSWGDLDQRQTLTKRLITIQVSMSPWQQPRGQSSWSDLDQGQTITRGTAHHHTGQYVTMTTQRSILVKWPWPRTNDYQGNGSSPYRSVCHHDNPEVNPCEVTLTKDKRLPGERLITIQVSMSPWQLRGQSSWGDLDQGQTVTRGTAHNHTGQYVTMTTQTSNLVRWPWPRTNSYQGNDLWLYR